MRIIVLFNLRPGISAQDYEAWAAARDIPTVRALPSVAGFDVAAVTGVLDGEGPAPCAYVEVIDVADMDRFGRDIGTEAMQAIAAEFRSFADAPVFLTTRALEPAA